VIEFRRSHVLVALVATALLSQARATLAVIVAGNYEFTSDTTVNRTAPTDDPGFYNVGSVGSGAALYLGNNWVLAANHVTLGATSFSFPDPANSANIVTGTYNIVSNSGVVLNNNSGPQQGTKSDLIMYRIDPASSPYGSPNLPQPILAQAAPVFTDSVVGVGRGVDRQSSLTYWDNHMPTWNTTTAGSAVHTGYITDGPQYMRWGDNQVSLTDQTYNLGTVAKPVYVQSFTTMFDRAGSGATANEFQATLGDSGGGVFHKGADGIWTLTGMIDGLTLLTGQPYPSPQTAVFGDMSIIADLYFYRSQILALNPLIGDANTDGIVNGQDASFIASHWLTAGPAGDLNGDGIVNGQDFVIVASHWTIPKNGGGAGAGSGAGGGAAVPEPATGLLAAMGLLALLGRQILRRTAAIHR